MNTRGYVYLMRAGEMFKIGRSNKPVRRLSELVGEATRHYGARPQIVHVIPTNNTRALEREMHHIFQRWRDSSWYGREWYRLPPAAVLRICAQSDPLGEPPIFPPDPVPEMECLLRPREAAALLGIDDRAMSAMIRAGQIKILRLGGRTTRIDPDEIRRLKGA